MTQKNQNVKDKAYFPFDFLLHKLHNPILCNDRNGSFVYGQKRSINVNHGDTLNDIFLSQTLINFTSFPTVLSEGLALLITFNGVTTWETYAGDHRRRSIS